jgi:hypothetical protein
MIGKFVEEVSQNFYKPTNRTLSCIGDLRKAVIDAMIGYGRGQSLGHPGSMGMG